MTKTHRLKLKECYWDSVSNGFKKAEVRLNDRDYQTGDYIVFDLIGKANELIAFAGNKKFKITHVLQGGQFGIQKGYCVLSIEKEVIE